MNFVRIKNGLIELNVAIDGDGPLILCVHGWPEHWSSWRHQIEYFARRGYKIAAMDVRGYGASSKPHEIAAYSMRNLTSDVVSVANAIGNGEAILFGHDWGAPIAWHTALLHPQRISAVAGLSVPYTPPSAHSFLDLMKKIYKDRFFYQLYFQPEGVAEKELEADVGTSLRKIYFALSGSAPPDQWVARSAVDGKLLDGLVDPVTFPDWLSPDDLKVYIDALSVSGFRGPLNRYRAQDLDVEELAQFYGRPVSQPSFFVAGERDMVRAIVPGKDLFANPGAFCTDFRGSVIIPGAGHWVQQEAPARTNAALDEFVRQI